MCQYLEPNHTMECLISIKCSHIIVFTLFHGCCTLFNRPLHSTGDLESSNKCEFISEFAPKDLFVKVLSPVQVMLSWTPGKSYSTNRTYIVSWFHKGLGVSDGHIRTPSTSVSITEKGLYGGRKYRFLVCLYIKKTMDYSDCVAQYATMPELPPLQAPEMSEPKQESSRGHEKVFFSPCFLCPTENSKLIVVDKKSLFSGF